MKLRREILSIQSGEFLARNTCIMSERRCNVFCFICCVSAVVPFLLYQQTWETNRERQLSNVEVSSTPKDNPFRKTTEIKDAFGTAPQPNQTQLEITRSIRQDKYKTVCAADDIQGPENLSSARRATVFSHIIVDDKRKFLFCFVPKVACSNWKRVIKYLQGNSDSIEKTKLNNADFVHLGDFSNNEVQYRLRNYYKFMFVRDPMERLLSAYRNKFFYNTKYPKQYGPAIVKRYRQKIVDGPYDDITFEEFVRFVVDTDVKRMNHHWRPMHELCQPCAIHYNFVGSFEHLQYDAKYVLEQIRGESDAYFPKRHKQFEPTKLNNTKFELPKVNPAYIEQFLDKYFLDFTMFGYAPPKKHIYKGDVFYVPSSP